MWLRWLLRAVVVLAAMVALASCASAQSASMAPQQRGGVAAYFAAHPTTPKMVPKGWSRGILITSSTDNSDCIKCSTWNGTVIAPDGAVVSLQSQHGESALFKILSIGDDFIWTGTKPSNTNDVKVLAYGAVPAATPQPTSSRPSPGASASATRTH